MVAATLLGVFFIPALYVLISTIAERISGTHVRTGATTAPEPVQPRPEPT